MKSSEATNLNRILAATDFSPSSQAAAAWATLLAKQLGSELTLFHSVTLPAPFPDFVAPEPGLATQLTEAARNRLERRASELADDDLTVQARLAAGEPSAAILEAVADLPADLLVLGTRGLSGLPHLLLGSTAEGVIPRAPCPVLTVREGSVAKLEGKLTVLAPSDFSPHAYRAARFARDLLRATGAELELVLFTAYQLPAAYTAYGLTPISPTYLELSKTQAEADLDEQARTLEAPGVSVRTRAIAGFPAESILDEAERQSADLIVMGTHGRTGNERLLWGSTAARVVGRAACPVLTAQTSEGD